MDAVRPGSTVNLKIVDGPLDGVVTQPQRNNEGIINGVGFRFADRYINHEMYILVVFRIRGESCNLAALLKRSEVHFDLVDQITPCSEARGLKPHRDKTSMFVDVVQLVQSPEAVVSSSVQIHSLEKILDFLPHSTHLSLISGYLVLGGWDVLGDGEGSLASWLVTVSDDELRSQVVKRAVQILNDIPCNDGDGWRDRVSGMNVNDVLSRLRITLTVNLIRVRFLELLDDSVELVDVLAGPLDF